MRCFFFGIALMLGCVMSGSLYASPVDENSVEGNYEVYMEAEELDATVYDEAQFADFEEFLDHENASSLRIMGAICCSDACREHPTDYEGCYERCVERTHMDC